MQLPKRPGKLISILLVLCICVFGIQLEQNQQCAFFAWNEEGEIPAESRVERHLCNLDDELFCASEAETLQGKAANTGTGLKRGGVHRSLWMDVHGVSMAEQTAYFANTMQMSQMPVVHRFIISYIYHQNGEKHSDLSYFPV